LSEVKYGFVYVIKLKNMNLVKIGITSNLKSRFHTFKVKKKCKVLAIIFTDDARRMERDIHKRLDEYRLPQSEWFALPENMIHLVGDKIQITMFDINNRYEFDAFAYFHESLTSIGMVGEIKKI